MRNNKFKISFFVLLLLSSTVFPSIQSADAQTSDPTIGPGQVTISDDQSYSGQNIIIIPNTDLLITGTGSLTIDGNLINQGNVMIDGTFTQIQPLEDNKRPRFILDFVSFSIRCGVAEGIMDYQGLGILTPECEDGSNIIEENNLIVAEDEKFTVLSNQILTLTGFTKVFGIFENLGTVNNLSNIELSEDGIMDMRDITNICANFGFVRVHGSGTIVNEEDPVKSTDCQSPDAMDDDFYITNEDTILDVDGISINGVLENDSEGDSPLSELTASAETNTIEGGTVVMNPEGTFQYTPKNNFFGEDKFQYKVIDGTGGTDTATVTIEITSVNDPPVAVNDPETGNISVNEDASVTIPVLNNDSDPEGDSLIVDSVIDGTIGTATHDGTTVTYTPNPNLDGLDSFTYTISDGNGGTSTATVNIIVIEQNDQPVITLNGLTPVDVELNIDGYTDEGAMASDLEDGDISELIVTTFDPNIVDESVLGTTEVVYNVEDSSGNAASEVRRTVNVVDKTDPVITLTGSSLEYIIKDIDTYTELGATVTDNDPTTSQAIIAGDTVDESEEGTYIITYDVSDPSGNAASQVTRTVNVIAGGTPTITLIGSDSVELVKDVDTYTELGATADDSEEGDISSSIVIAGDTVDESEEGTYIITYDVQDSSGNDAIQVIRTVDVVNDNLREQTIEQITELEDLIDEATDKKTRDEINKALKELNKSVETKKWEDNGNYLVDNQGKKVFDEQDKGVEHIVHLLDHEKESGEFLSKVTSIVLDLIDIDEELAGNEFSIAEKSPDSEQSCLDDAEKELEKSDKEEGKGEYDKAIDHLGHLWEKSLKCQGIDIGGPGPK